MTLEAAQTGDQLKADGMAHAIADAATWSERARAAIEWLADQGVEFTSENVVNLVGLPHGEVGKDRNNAVGAVISGAARRGIIRRLRYENARRGTLHSAVVGVWQGTQLAIDGTEDGLVDVIGRTS